MSDVSRMIGGSDMCMEEVAWLLGVLPERVGMIWVGVGTRRAWERRRVERC